MLFGCPGWPNAGRNCPWLTSVGGGQEGAVPPVVPVLGRGGAAWLHAVQKAGRVGRKPSYSDFLQGNFIYFQSLTAVTAQRGKPTHPPSHILQGLHFSHGSM